MLGSLPKNKEILCSLKAYRVLINLNLRENLPFFFVLCFFLGHYEEHVVHSFIRMVDTFVDL